MFLQLLYSNQTHTEHLVDMSLKSLLILNSPPAHSYGGRGDPQSEKFHIFHATNLPTRPGQLVINL